VATEANWYPDPTGGHQLRYWDGNVWTAHVSDNGVTGQAAMQPPPLPVAATTSTKPWYKRPVPLMAIGAAAVIVIAVAANAGGGGSGGSTTFPVSNLAAAELETGSFFDPGITQLGSFDVVAGIPGCDADVALSLMQGADTDWPTAIKVPYEKVIADIQREQVACANTDQAAFASANDDAAADLTAAGRAWDAAHCKVDDVFAESPTATCK